MTLQSRIDGLSILRLNRFAIDTKHLLLALVREENGVAVKVLRESSVELGQVMRTVEQAVRHLNHACAVFIS